MNGAKIKEVLYPPVAHFARRKTYLSKQLIPLAAGAEIFL